MDTTFHPPKMEGSRYVSRGISCHRLRCVERSTIDHANLEHPQARPAADTTGQNIRSALITGFGAIVGFERPAIFRLCDLTTPRAGLNPAIFVEKTIRFPAFQPVEKCGFNLFQNVHSITS